MRGLLAEMITPTLPISLLPTLTASWLEGLSVVGYSKAVLRSSNVQQSGAGYCRRG